MLDAPWRARFGVAAVVAIGLLIATSVWPQGLRLSYEVWRVLHGVLAAVIMITALAHVEAVGHYVSGPWRRALWAVMSLAVVALLAWVRLVNPVLILRRPWRLAEVVERAPGVHSLVLEAEGHDGMRSSRASSRGSPSVGRHCGSRSTRSRSRPVPTSTSASS